MKTLKLVVDWLKRHQTLVVLFFIGAVIFIANLPNAVLSDYFVEDDYHCFSNFVTRLQTGQNIFVHTGFPWNISNYSEPLAQAIIFYLGYDFARLFYLLFLLIPASYFFYGLLRQHLGFPRIEAVIAATMPAILPLQIKIISGINCSYTLLPLFFLWLAFYFIIAFLKSWEFYLGKFILGVGFYALATRCSEHAAMVFPVILLIIFCCGKNWWRKIMVFFPTITLAVLVFLRMYYRPRGVAVPQDLSWAVQKWRIMEFLKYLSPIASDYRGYAIAICVGLFFSGIIVLLFKLNKKNNPMLYLDLSDDIGRFWPSRPLFIIMFAGGFMLCAVLPFLLVSQYFTVRYLAMAGYGYWILGALGLGGICRLIGKAMKFHSLVWLLALAMIVGCMYEHMKNTIEAIKPENKVFHELRLACSYIEIPKNSYVAMIGARIPGSNSGAWLNPGFHMRERANRIDIKGNCFATHTYFRELFHTNHLNYWKAALYNPYMLLPHKNNEFVLDGLVIYQYFPQDDVPPEKKLRKYNYFLRAIKKNSVQGNYKVNDWFLYESAGKGKWRLRNQGHGKKDYEKLLYSELKEVGIRPADIAWGNPVNQSEN